MAAPKYVALKDFGNFKVGDAVPAGKVEDADQLLSGEFIKLAEEPAQPEQNGVDSPTFDDTKSSQPTPAEPKLTSVRGENGTVTATFG